MLEEVDLMDEYVEEVMESGDRLPSELWLADLSETYVADAVYDGTQIVSGSEVAHGA